MLLGLAHLVVLECRFALARRRVDDLEAEAPVRQADDLLPACPGPLAPRVGDDHDLELEPLRGVDGQQPHRPGALFLRHRLQLLHAGRVLLDHEPDEALDVGAAQLLVRAGKARELAQVGVAPPAVPLREDGEVIVVLDEDLLAEPLEPDGAGDRRQPVVALAERLEQLRVAFGQAVGQSPLEPRVERAPRRRPAQQRERVVRDADERRRKHGDERLVVVTVVQQAQITEQVAHLLLAEVPPARGPVGRQSDRAQLFLVLLRIGAGGEKQHDLARVARRRRRAPSPAGRPPSPRRGATVPRPCSSPCR